MKQNVRIHLIFFPFSCKKKMSRQFVDLPSEIFDVIFGIIRDECNFRCLLQCELVCKSWKTSAQNCLYTNIEFRNEKEVKRLIHTLTCQPNSNPGKFTRSVVYNGCIEDVKKETWSLFKIFEYLFGKRDETPWINSFIEVFPYVRNISLAKEDSSYFWVLVNAFGSGKWKEMEYIGKCPEEFIDSHNACALWNKNTLKTLHVCDSKESGFCSLYNQLQIFPKLKELYMETNQYSFSSMQNMLLKPSQVLKPYPMQFEGYQFPFSDFLQAC